MNNTTKNTWSSQARLSWAHGLSRNDIDDMHRLAAMSPAGLVAEIRKLYDQAYKVGIQEAKEMSKGRYLNVFPKEKKE